MTEEQYKQCTSQIKALADIRNLKLDDTDSIIRNFYNNLSSADDMTEDKAPIPNEEVILSELAANKKKLISGAADHAVNGNHAVNGDRVVNGSH